MCKIFLAVSSMIVTAFIIKSYRKLHENPEAKEEQIHRAIRDAREQWLREHRPKHHVAEVNARLMRNDPSAALASIEAFDNADAMATGRFA